MKRLSGFLVGIIFVSLLATSLPAQSIYGALTGIVSDPSQAVVAGAAIKLRDEQSGSLRETVANTDGYYSFVSVPPGGYELTVTAPGFEGYKQTGIAIRGGDKINVNVSIKLGSTTNVVEVTGSIDLATPVDSGENFNRLTTKELENFVQLGSNAAEFIKMMPGFSISNGINNYANYNGQTVGINGNGNGGNQSPLNNAYSYNGLPSNTLDITADGAHVSDPGCNCATPVNPNSNMISEFKISMSNFSAENQKGPGVISSVAKGGGRDYHGSAYTTARNAVMNANDWLSNFSRVPRPENQYYYPGFNIGGPVKLPFSSFNKNRDKLFFYSGYQHFFQVLDTGLLRATVPTAGEREGNFSPEEIAKEGRITSTGAVPVPMNAKALALYPGGIIPKTAIDASMQSLMKLYPLPNADPNANGGYNWVDDLHFNQNGFQWMSRVDYSISENTKLYIRYNMQREVQLFPIGLWSASTTTPPYPTPIEGKNRSDSVTASLTKVFNNSMTNEIVLGYTFIGFPNVFQDPSKVDRTKVGYAYKGLFKNGVAQIPNLGASGEVSALSSGQGGFEVGGKRGIYADKYLPSASDILSKIWGTHSLKAGVFWEHIRNSQPASNFANGVLGVSNGNSNSFGNPYADQILGNLNSYQETSFNRLNDIAYDTYEGFIQDNWKVTKRLTLEMGVRITQFTPWTDNLGFGFSIFDYSKYSPTCKPTDYCGFLWHARDSSVPLTGFPKPPVFFQPRFGMAYAMGDGSNTVLRGGWGRYYYHSGQFTTGLNVSAGMQTINLTNNQGIGNGPLLASQLDSLSGTSAALSTGAVDSKNNRDPYTDSYSFTISQRVPWSGLVEASYVGNQTRNILNTAGGFGSDINLVPVGAMLSSKNGGVDPATLNANNFRPLVGFAGLPLSTNSLYANYNSMQMKYVRTKGGTIINANYTYGKAMQILNATADSFNLNNNYGVQPTNRKHIFNIAYSHNFGKFVRNKFAGGVINNWQVSGIVQVQSGTNLTGQRGQTFGMALNSAKIPGTTYNISNVSLLGTPNITLNPIYTCDPGKNLAEHQFLNQACYTFPNQIGQNGPTIGPVVYGPAYFNADLGIFKNFPIKEQKKLQLRANAYNFLNHPLWSFGGSSNLNLGFTGATGVLNTPNFGYVTTKQGHRIVQLAATFNF